jgi:hypothetical protein
MGCAVKWWEVTPGAWGPHNHLSAEEPSGSGHLVEMHIDNQQVAKISKVSGV